MYYNNCMIFRQKNQGIRGKLHNFIKEYKSKNLYPLHMPGHKQKYGDISRYDYTEIPGFDDLHDPSGLILDIMNGYSNFYGTYSTYLSVNGSTSGILAAISTLKLFGKNFLIARNSHKSVYNGIFINNVNARYFKPVINEIGIVKDYDYDEIEEMIIRYDIDVLVITSPTYEGIKIDITKINAICIRNNVLILADAAHGAHLIDEPINRIADIVIQSIHKTLPAPTSTAIVHCNNKKLDYWLRHYMSVYQTSSPSYILLSGISECLEYLEDKYEEDHKKALLNLRAVREKLDKCKNIGLFKNDDEFKIVIEGKGKVTGEEIYNYLYDKGYVAELFTESYVIAMTGVMDDWEKIDILADLLLKFDICIGEKNKDYKKRIIQSEVHIPEYVGIRNPEFERVDISDAIGRISAEPVYIYPPGIPIITYGEVFDEEVIKNLEKLIEKKLIQNTKVTVQAVK